MDWDELFLKKQKNQTNKNSGGGRVWHVINSLFQVGREKHQHQEMLKAKGAILELDNEGEVTGAQHTRAFEKNFVYDIHDQD